MLAFALAPACAACQHPLDRPSDGAVCAACWASLRKMVPPVCTRCGDQLATWRALSPASSLCPSCRDRPALIAEGRAAGVYEGTLRTIIHAFKYDGRRTLARPLGARMRDAARDLLHDADCVVPVPLHPWRRLRRGFNQASDLARQLGPPVVPALWKIRSTPAQIAQSAQGRRRNLRGAVRLSPLLRHDLKDCTVVLVDDVRTTGATLEACARALLDAGVGEVRAVTAAVARVSRPIVDAAVVDASSRGQATPGG